MKRLYEPRREKTGFLHMRKQRPRRDHQYTMYGTGLPHPYHTLVSQCTETYPTRLQVSLTYEPCLTKTAFCTKTRAQMSCTVTTHLISAFVFATRIVQFLYFLNLKFQASSHHQWLYSPVCMGPGRKPRRPVFSQRGSYNLEVRSYERLCCPLACCWNADELGPGLICHHIGSL